MIPKVIHYCWFGKQPLDKKVISNIRSWKKYCPDYEIIQWNESNFDIKKYQFAFEAYTKKQWAFVSDVARLDIIYNNGGFYLDTDVELLSSLDNFTKDKVFLAREDKYSIATGLGFGAEINDEFILCNLSEYQDKHFINSDGTLNKIICVDITTHLLSLLKIKPSNKVQKVKEIKIYPREYFCPMRISSGKVVITKNTVSIHHYSASWKSKEDSSSKNYLIPIKKMIKFYTDRLLGFGTYNHIKQLLKK
ncbi:glycosyltransferase family 32 protein [Latilactobacillus sakei]|uniref:glycosyltransferase family 32 protein n=1 Tax=Latilactobacillus sakei TaxID=1599 RepID=UPI000DCAA451|nr:glycosyltransferase [Latilactobacillus sakei]AWZ44725.1 glycosyl transferase [Latilactobacillus sakei]